MEATILHNHFELRRKSDGLVYQFDRFNQPNGDTGYKRRDKDLWIVWKPELGWVAFDEASGEIQGRAWNVLPQHQGEHPPAGEWVSKKGAKSYVYELVYVRPNKPSTQPIHIRPEAESDIPAIRYVTELAFRDKAYAGGHEQDVIDRLRSAGALTLSLVAVDSEGVVVGQVTFSPTTNSDGSGEWFALGPVAVLPTHQGQGIGRKLIEQGLAQISEQGALGCILTGNPNYYRRFGFEVSAENAPPNEPAKSFMLKTLHGDKPSGQFAFHRAFYAEV